MFQALGHQRIKKMEMSVVLRYIQGRWARNTHETCKKCKMQYLIVIHAMRKEQGKKKE